MLRTQSDARLVDLVRAGHAAAFEAIVQRYRRQLLAYCSRLLPASRAEDAVQQTFLKAYQAMISGDAELNLRPWLYRIAHNASLNLLRQNGWSHEPLDENMDGVQRPDQALELRERLRSTVQAVKSLPERQRNAVLLREVEGLSYEEIALALGVGDGAVRQLLHRARATLRAGATAVTPAGLVERLTSAMASGGDPVARATELVAGTGAGVGALKLGAAVLATGVIATGAVTGVPLRHHARHGSAHIADQASAAAKSTGGSSSSSGGSVASTGVLVNDHSGRHGGGHGESRHSHRGRDGGHGSGSSGRSGDRHGSSSGGSDDSSSPDGSGDDHRSGSSGGGSGSGSSGSGSGGSRDGSGDRLSGSGSGS
ncbi:MAG TPA: sigma-70 family RNA polymerase sigma factor, partial [Thermoleophilaceae bacterium]|nr:sigma-70 family RNA polymerase sigma factor [Thermoleophilaceae bacterium]